MLELTPSVVTLLVCALGSPGGWVCGIQPLPVPAPAPPPITAPAAPAPAPAVVITPPPGPSPAPPAPPALPVPPALQVPAAPIPPRPPAPQVPAPPRPPAPQVPAPPAPAPRPDPNRLPGDVLDLSDWNLTLPTGAAGSPDTIEQPRLSSYASEYFRLNRDRNGVVFTATVDGVTTKNSHYPRSELREMNGSAKASWSNRRGTHILHTRQAITAIPAAKPEVVSAQIHDGDDDVMQVRLEGSRLVVRYADGAREIVIDPDYRLGTVFDLKIVAAQGRVQVFYDGAPKARINQSGTGWYFKSGSYVQSNPSKGERPDAAGSVVIYSLSVTHSE